MAYTVHKYCGGAFCGMAEGKASIDECMEFADDGFCDYARVVRTRADGTRQTIRIHFEPTERGGEWYEANAY